MFVITLDGKETEGAYSLTNDDGEQVLLIFQEEDDAVRYAMMLEEDGYPDMHVIEMDDDIIIKTCNLYGYQYTLITPNDIIIPPDTENDYF
jgi:hypothetical protein